MVVGLEPSQCCGDYPTAECVCLTFTSELYTISFILTAVGIAFIFFTVYVLRMPKTPLTNMIVGISIFDLVFTGPIFILNCISTLNDSLCTSFIFISQIGVHSSFAWAVCFTHACYDLITNEHNTRIRENMKFYILITLAVGILSAILSTIFELTDYYDNSCVHIVHFNSFDLSAFFGVHLQFTVAVILSLYYSIKSIRGLNKLFGGGNYCRWFVMLKYPIILILCWIPLQLGSLLNQAGVKIGNNDVALAFEIIVLSQGFLNALVYGISRRTISGLAELCKRCCTSKNKHKVAEQEPSMDDSLVAKYAN